jgi:hypothetical protein
MQYSAIHPQLLLILLAAFVPAVGLSRDARADDGWQPVDTTPPKEPPAAASPGASPPPEESEATQRPELGRDSTKVGVELGGSASYLTAPIRGGTSPFGAGFGGRVGLVFGGFYVGARVVDYLGGSDVHLSDKALLYGVEVGYGFPFASVGGSTFTLRPQVGVGDAAIAHTDPSLAKVDIVTTASGSSSSSSSDTITVNSIYLQPGITAMFSAGSNFVALNGSMLVIPSISYGGSSDSATWLCYGLQADLGFRF